MPDSTYTDKPAEPMSPELMEELRKSFDEVEAAEMVRQAEALTARIDELGQKAEGVKVKHPEKSHEELCDDLRLAMVRNMSVPRRLLGKEHR